MVLCFSDLTIVKITDDLVLLQRNLFPLKLSVNNFKDGSCFIWLLGPQSFGSGTYWKFLSMLVEHCSKSIYDPLCLGFKVCTTTSIVYYCSVFHQLIPVLTSRLHPIVYHDFDSPSSEFSTRPYISYTPVQIFKIEGYQFMVRWFG